MGALTTPQPKEFGRLLNWLLALLAALLAAVFAVRGWLYPLLLGCLFGAITGGIATLNLPPQERYLRAAQARRAALRTGSLVAVGQILSLAWLLPTLAPRTNGNFNALSSAMVTPFMLSLLLALLTIVLALGAGRYGDEQARRITPVTFGLGGAIPSVAHPDWIKERRPIPAAQFSPGANHDFAWYFEGELKHPIKTVDDILDFLKKCEYISDNHLFMREDFWQHPVTFEQIRKGDCEDSSLWAWRRLKDLNYPAELVSGIFLKNGGHHAWVHVLIDGQQFVLETTRKMRHPLIPMSEAVKTYRPFVAVDHQFSTYRFAGADKPRPVPGTQAHDEP